MTIGAEQVRAGLGQVRERIVAAGGDPERITVVAVTKGFGVEAVEAAREAGATHVGENYAQELLAKAEALAPGPAPLLALHRRAPDATRSARWRTSWTCGSPSIARRSGPRWPSGPPGARVLVQVNISGEATKSGCPPENTATLVAALRDLGLDVRGLMGVAAPGDDGRARAQFRRLAEQAAALELAELSMGMSADLEAAVAEGATIVRVGTALFGPRPPR